MNVLEAYAGGGRTGPVVFHRMNSTSLPVTCRTECRLTAMRAETFCVDLRNMHPQSNVRDVLGEDNSLKRPS
ncbi:hypothetical protein, partial [Mesorhizobium sp.]|uniref:hypothetical protein n=1 Tax=Mesorhizobium sp. TaxID=1871066 RepID=UPI0025BAF883